VAGIIAAAINDFGI
jgi:subtilisin family serine protease